MPAAARRSLAPLAVVTAAAFLFALLLVLVRLQWAPLESADHSAAARLNSLIAGHAAVVSSVKAVTWLGSGGVLWTLIGMAVVVLAIRRRWRLAIYLLVTGAGELTLDPVLKALVGRLRPVVAHPVAYGNGDSFPSGHALGSLVCYGALFLVFLPATRGAWRRVFIAVIVTLIVAIGASRLLLGVHYLSDVLGAWALGITWLGVTACAFELSRQASGAPVTDPVTEGLEPEARTDLQPAEPETTMHHDRARKYVVEPPEPDRQQPRGNPGHPHRERGHLRRVPRRHPSLAAGGLRRRGHGRRAGCLPDRRGHGQAPATRRPPPRLEPAHLGVPVRPRGRDHVPLR